MGHIGWGRRCGVGEGVATQRITQHHADRRKVTGEEVLKTRQEFITSSLM